VLFVDEKPRIWMRFLYLAPDGMTHLHCRT
jgi:hypothetical protein